MFFVPSAVNRAQMWLVQPVCNTRGTHKETMRRQAAPGTPDGILMSGVSSPLSDSRSDALMPSHLFVRLQGRDSARQTKRFHLLTVGVDRGTRFRKGVRCSGLVESQDVASFR